MSVTGKRRVSCLGGPYNGVTKDLHFVNGRHRYGKPSGGTHVHGALGDIVQDVTPSAISGAYVLAATEQQAHWEAS
jgi:hypothetical protein